MPESEPASGEAGRNPDEAAAESSAHPAATDSPDRIQSILRLVGSVVAPTTVLTALLFYFGWAHAYWFFNHFGIDITLLGLTTQDYMMRSVDALFVPLTVALSLVPILVWAHSAVGKRFFVGPEARARLRMSGIIVATAGVVLFLIGMLAVFRGWRHLAYPLSLGAGTILVLYGSRLRRRSEGATVGQTGFGARALLEATGAFLLVVLSLFWAATNYAAAVGETRARQFERTSWYDYPGATLYSKESLQLDAPGVQETLCTDEAAGYRFRYQGLRLMLRSAGQYFFLPEDWSPRDGVAIVVPEGDTVRLQFTAPGRDEPHRSSDSASC